VLDVMAWGGDAHSFDWFEAPPADRLEAAIALLRQLDAIEGNKLTAIGEELRGYPLHPRLARMIVATNGDDTAIKIAAAISEGVRLTSNATTKSDAFALADGAPREIVRELKRIGHPERERGAWASGRGDEHDSLARPTRSIARARDDIILKAILAAYPDRVAQRREPTSDRLLLASGTGALLARESGVRDGEFLVALDVAGSGGGEALVRMASFVDRDWLTPTHFDRVHAFANDRVKAVERAWYGAILLFERPADVDPIEAQRLIDANRRVDPVRQQRIDFAGSEKNLDRLAPLTIPLPSGRTARLDYREDGSVVAAVKLQELFGLAETPRIGPHQTPITFELLAPNGRPVQVTRDLRSFWNGAYQEVRKELRARYPRHPWPEDPWTAKPTHRTKKR